VTASPAIDLRPFIADVRDRELLPWTGQVAEIAGTLIASRGPAVAMGDFCEVCTSSGRRIRTQVIGFRQGLVLSMPLEEIDGTQLHDRVIARPDEARVPVCPELIGRVVDGFGRTIDRGPRIRAREQYNLYQPPGSPLDRQHITDPISRWHAALRKGPADGHLRWQRRRQEHAAGIDGPP
jgi:flagellar biosynthesis/type III secretory pathway ATPase